jgi:hypothetical protein
MPLAARMRLAPCAVALLVASAPVAWSACGDRGGPGYRAADGRCVGWADIGRSCGSPPTKRCTPENVASGADEAARLGTKIEALRPAR